mmetsp:Transcript_29726/g.31927  ORF Transcript_29726/g.31927 Transcript_29726/m.31927 type:complete len:187 (+) Transcript_29726:954-1514(+)
MEAVVASDKCEDLNTMGEEDMKTSGAKKHPVDSTDNDNKNIKSSKKATTIVKKRVILNEEGESVTEEVTISRAETEKLEKKRENWNKRKNRKGKEDKEERNLNKEDKNQLKDLEQNKTDEECGQELKKRQEELEMDIEQTQYQINNCYDDQKENIEIQMMEYKKLRQELYPSNEEEEAIEEDEASQ